MTKNTVDTGVSERGSYELDLLRQTDVIEWCKRWTLGPKLLVGGNYFGVTPLAEIMGLLKKQLSPLKCYPQYFLTNRSVSVPILL